MAGPRRLLACLPAVPVLLAVGAAAGCSGPAGAPSGSSSSSPAVATASAPSTTAPATPDPSPSSSGPASATASTTAAPALAPVPAAGAEPAVRFPTNPPAVGAGANATVGQVPDPVWNAMVGYSWTPGCPVGRSQLRYVQVNFWGFDGKRSRGSLVVNATIARQTVSAFTRLYAMAFRIRQMRPMDISWGHNPKGPGADDYAAMEADNTSAFNCRYVGGEEATKVYSNHAYGRAIDVNDFENPYVDSHGVVYPGTYFLHRRTGAGVFGSTSSAAVRAFTDLGFTWGGTWSDPDYQHFER